MELGQRIRQARLEAGISQRQLCGDTITRNMLSQIEHGTVQPSVGTLRFLASQLNKSVGFFLDEESFTSPNASVMAQARERFASGNFAGVIDLLTGYQEPDSTFDWERHLLQARCWMELARQAVTQGRLPYGAELLKKAGQEGRKTPYFGTELERERLLLLAQAEPEENPVLPVDDRELLVRAKAALAAGDGKRCACLLEAAEDRQTQQWFFLRGEAYLLCGEYVQAADYYQRVERTYPRQSAARLEQCFRELEDYKMAYYYACKQREKGHHTGTSGD